MDEQVLRRSEYRSVPWKNGGGTTREVAEGAAWRVSVADVAGDGPFSLFPDTDRVITPVEADGTHAMTLTVQGTPHHVTPLTPFAFPGDAPTDCHLPAGAVRNLNVMTRRGRATARVRIVDVTAAGGAEPVCGTDETLLLMPVTEGLTLAAPDSRDTPLARLDCVRRTGPGTLRLRGEGTAAEIRITTAR
ncbi:HutD family protein [Streptomyces sp. Je 1-369]|uniref:HutD/Ves family protein n=1 Tax=Streptomyces sp. Je 1-369 TaxID=2966192 RepID=UPI002285F585|nr:HutD family protein [Streptomyces sp. Je 1-369]WAL98446.1 HutD family protein [Streptomyces sp. Je 1-369]